MLTQFTYSSRTKCLKTSLALSYLASIVVAALMQPVFAIELGKTLDIQNSNVSAQIESVDSNQAEQEKLKALIAKAPPAYQDKVMSAPELLDLSTQETEEPEPTGFQSYALETRASYADASTNTGSGSKLANSGVRAEYLYETPNFGDLSIQFQTGQQRDNTTKNNLSVATQQTASSFTLFNNNLQLTPTMAADSALGDVSSELTTVLRRNSRFSLGVDTIRGARTRLSTDQYALAFGSGELGELKNNAYSGYQKTDGKLSWIGASYKLNDKFMLGAQLNQADSFKALEQNNKKISSFAAALAYEDDANKKLRISLLKSQYTEAETNQKTAQAAYLEGNFQVGRYAHEFGVYQSEPDLYFGKNRLNSADQGAYWRFNRESNHFTFSAGLSFEKSQLELQTQAGSSQRVGLDGSVRYRIDRDHSYGGSLRLQQNSYDNVERNDQRSLYGYGYYQLINADWGRSRVSLTLHRNETIVSNDTAATGDELQWEQDWLSRSASTLLNAQPELVTTLGIAHDRSANETQTYPTAGVNLRYWPDADWSVSSNLRYSSRSGKLSTSQGIAGSVSTEYTLAQGLKLGALVSLNQAKVEIDSNGLNTAETVRSTDKSGQIYLRWEGSRGSGHSVLGKRTPGLAGTGSTVGFVFFDKNQDGERQADEAGVPEVEVYLDGGFSARTDKNGYYEFMRVATGSHALTLNLDTVPLPWSVKEDSLSVEVSLRGQATANLALTKGAD